MSMWFPVRSLFQNNSGTKDLFFARNGLYVEFRSDSEIYECTAVGISDTYSQSLS